MKVIKITTPGCVSCVFMSKILDEIEQAGLVGPANGAKPRDILMPHAQSSDNSAE